jgi:hypothetical protein
MKILVSTLMLSCLIAVSAFAGDSEEILRERLILCSQFVIEEPGTAIPGTTRYCCGFANRIPDCRVRYRDEQDRR